MPASFVRPEPPYFAVIITTRPTPDLDGYTEMSDRMAELGAEQPGYLGRESLTDADGRELVVIYYADETSIAAWKAHPEHLEAQRLGRERWYSSYVVEIARVERAYAFSREAAGDPAVG